MCVCVHVHVHLYVCVGVCLSVCDRTFVQMKEEGVDGGSSEQKEGRKELTQSAESEVAYPRPSHGSSVTIRSENVYYRQTH